MAKVLMPRSSISMATDTSTSPISRSTATSGRRPMDALNALCRHQHHRTDQHGHAQGGNPLDALRWLLRHQQQDRGQRAGAGHGGHCQGHDQGLGHLLGVGGLWGWKHHAQGDQKQNHPAANLQRQLAEVHQAQKALAHKHEHQQQHKGNQDFAQDHPRSALRWHMAQGVGKNRDVATGSVIKISNTVADQKV